MTPATPFNSAVVVFESGLGDVFVYLVEGTDKRPAPESAWDLVYDLITEEVESLYESPEAAQEAFLDEFDELWAEDSGAAIEEYKTTYGEAVKITVLERPSHVMNEEGYIMRYS